MRIFLAIDVDEECKRILAESLRPVQKKLQTLSWTTPEQWHITLAFLGEVTKEKVFTLQDELETIAISRFSLEIGGGGVFPHWGMPRVFWAGVSESEEMRLLYTSLWKVLEHEGFSPENRDFHPHVTLARIKSSLSLEEKKLLQLVCIPQRWVNVEAFFLYQSELTPYGARYTKLRTYPLKESHDG
ncbi:MAG: RNA 2',3'-cyclic phosphodiesterase [Brevinematales bacterium]|nr:RNA 2',3'-cyclic phosphodiesterase [Brevinematales bacterium]